MEVVYNRLSFMKFQVLSIILTDVIGIGRRVFMVL